MSYSSKVVPGELCASLEIKRARSVRLPIYPQPGVRVTSFFSPTLPFHPPHPFQLFTLPPPLHSPSTHPSIHLPPLHSLFNSYPLALSLANLLITLHIFPLPHITPLHALPFPTPCILFTFPTLTLLPNYPYLLSSSSLTSSVPLFSHWKKWSTYLKCSQRPKWAVQKTNLIKLKIVFF